MPLLVFLFAGQRKGLEFFCLSCHDHLPVLPSGHLRGPPPWCHVPRLRHDRAGAPSFRMSDLLYAACSPVVALAATSLVASDHCLSSGWTLGTPPHPFQRQCPSARPAHQPARPLPSPPGRPPPSHGASQVPEWASAPCPMALLSEAPSPSHPRDDCSPWRRQSRSVVPCVPSRSPPFLSCLFILYTLCNFVSQTSGRPHSLLLLTAPLLRFSFFFFFFFPLFAAPQHIAFPGPGI